MTQRLRTARRRKLARALRFMTGGRRDLPQITGTAADDIGARLVEIATETHIPLRDSDQAELLARLRLDDRIPPDIAAAICAALLPVLIHSAGDGDAR